MARPPKEKSLCKGHQVTVRFTEVQFHIIENNAKQLGVTVAEYIRHMSVHGKVTIKYPIVVDLPELEKFTNELAAIGNNLNQSARYFNLGGLQSQAMRERINSCIAAIMEMRKKVLDMAGDFQGFSQTSIK